MYRDKALVHYGTACDECDIAGQDTNLIEVHHRDGDRKNNDVLNLRVLCRPCHRALHARLRCERDEARRHKMWEESEARRRTDVADWWLSVLKTDVTISLPVETARLLRDVSPRLIAEHGESDALSLAIVGYVALGLETIYRPEYAILRHDEIVGRVRERLT